MKTKIILFFTVLAFLLGPIETSRAFDDFSPEAMAADGLVVRPFCLVATIIGSAVFVVSLPFTAIAGKAGQTADVLIGKPGRATFVRDMGDFSSF